MEGSTDEYRCASETITQSASDVSLTQSGLRARVGIREDVLTLCRQMIRILTRALRVAL